jgi:Mg2+ and Co2+ transporter CorA
VTELKHKLRKAEDTIKSMADEANRRLREISSLKAEVETLKASTKLSSTAGYVKMLKKLEKVGPRAHILMNLYHSTKG